jgi:hypothetical protein
MNEDILRKKWKMFKSRKRKWKSSWDDKVWIIEEYQCPICKRWFNSSNTYGAYTNFGLKLHISKVARMEAVEKMLGNIKKTPHFDFWKAYTKNGEKPVGTPRVWIF